MGKKYERESFGPNIWLVDDMHRRYQENPKSVGEAWREFFEDYVPNRGVATRPRAGDGRTKDPRTGEPGLGAPELRDGSTGDRRSARAPESGDQAGPEGGDQKRPPEGAAPLRGVSARIAENMEASLGVPTATSVRTMPAKLLEENRRIINRYLGARSGGKVSYTHVIGWAILKALAKRPAMNSSFAEFDGKPYLIQHKHVNFGLAVDVERAGSRTLVVPNIKNADDLDFAGFWSGYEELIRRVRRSEIAPEDFVGTTVTLTNPGTVGTSQSVPRLMTGQGLIVGTGAIAYPPEYEAADPATIARLGVSKLITITSTYDHRIIQGAESGQFLAEIHGLLLGQDRFYDELFASLRIPYEPARWHRDRGSGDDVASLLEKQGRVTQLINMYRVRGHLLAELNPIGWEILSHPELDLSHYGLTVWDLDREFLTDGIPGPHRQTLRQIIDTLRDAYCHTTGVEYMHISDHDQKAWVQQKVEPGPDVVALEEKKHILDRLIAAEAFERFVHAKYTGHKRYSLEGAETLIPMLDALLEDAAASGMVEVVMGMAHRGRLNVLANIVGKPLKIVFKEFEGDVDPNTVQGSGDVKYHVGMTGRFTSQRGDDIGIVMSSNPSHLESNDPVVEGMARAKQDLIGEGADKRVLPLLLHGDAAFAGQGVVAETLNMSQLPGYKTGGTVHIVVNNNIGFTTSPQAGRSSTYATDIAKMVQAPILHVNGDDPEACVGAIRLAFAFRQEFCKDVVIDLVCYRRHGHQEVDDPSFTQPLMYQRIQERRSVRKLYTEYLVNRQELTVEEAEASLEEFQRRMQGAFEQTKESAPPKDVRAITPRVRGVLPTIDSGVGRERLERVHEVLTSWPSGFEPHPKLKRMLEKRRDLLERDAIDWAHGEALAFGTLLLEGIPVRLSGQDSRRGTFSQRHSVLVDYRTGEEYMPLSSIDTHQAEFRAYDSLLSEYAALGFDYGYSIANQDALVLWEAQFGDFVNGAQVIIDQYIVAGEDKWGQESGLVLLLPHGYEGQGPEHSSARLERFLTLSAEDSIQVTQPTTPAQYFHLLRRQVKRLERKPLVVLTPKSLLRHADARSKSIELTSGHFRETLDDPLLTDRDAVDLILLCTGKIAYELKDERERRNANVAVVRVEQLYPFPGDQLAEIFNRYPNARRLRWVQDEPENMGAWSFMQARLDRDLPERLHLSHAARFESASPATGSQQVHQQEHEDLMEAAFGD
jgi:2-oxoglutarate decarboxylase